MCERKKCNFYYGLVKKDESCRSLLHRDMDGLHAYWTVKHKYNFSRLRFEVSCGQFAVLFPGKGQSIKRTRRRSKWFRWGGEQIREAFVKSELLATQGIAGPENMLQISGSVFSASCSFEWLRGCLELLSLFFSFQMAWWYCHIAKGKTLLLKVLSRGVIGSSHYYTQLHVACLSNILQNINWEIILLLLPCKRTSFETVASLPRARSTN